jgi:hypothetical protein
MNVPVEVECAAEAPGAEIGIDLGPFKTLASL